VRRQRRAGAAITAACLLLGTAAALGVVRARAGGAPRPAAALAVARPESAHRAATGRAHVSPPAARAARSAATASGGHPTRAAARPAVQAVAALRGSHAPSAFVTLSAPLTDAQRAAVLALPSVEAVTVVDSGTLTVDGRRHPALGVDPSPFRAFTPLPTASSDGLWQVVARGELAASYGDDAPAHNKLGHALAVRANGTRQIRLGAFAGFGLQQAGVVVSHSRARQLGLSPDSGLLVSAGLVEPTALRDRLAALTGGQVQLLGAAAAAVETVRPATGGRASTWRELYMSGATQCPGLSWTVLAAIGQVESGHGRNNGPSSAGAVGPMQFLPSTFALYAVDGDRDGRTSPWDAYDAVPAAARLLCAAGAGQGGAGLQRAVFAYNHAQWYVDEVLALAARYH